jgi:amino acid transporter
MELEVIGKAATDQMPPSYRLKQNILTPLETLAQSVSTIAPSTTPTMTIPLVFALAGNGTWLAYALALGALTLVALTIAAFARHSASPGSLYVYTRETLPPFFAALGALALFFAYVTTASSVIGGFVAYCYVVFGHAGAHIPAVVYALLAAAVAIAIAFRDIQISTQLMLWIEGVSVFLIAVIVALFLARHGLHVDRAQLRLDHVAPVGLRLGVMLALFSFVGFESATTLGEEAHNPLKTIPQAVVRSAIWAGLFFVVCAYGEVLAFHGATPALNDTPAPLSVLATQAGLPFVGRVIDLGVLVSMFAATLACVIAGARVLMLMAHHGLAPRAMGRTHAAHDTPGLAGLATGLLAVIPAAILADRGVSGADIYGYMGSIAVFGFLTAYGLVAAALPIHMHRRGELTPAWIVLSVLATAAVLAAIAGTIFPIPPAPYRFFPYVYLGYLILGLSWYTASGKKPA